MCFQRENISRKNIYIYITRKSYKNDFAKKKKEKKKRKKEKEKKIINYKNELFLHFFNINFSSNISSSLSLLVNICCNNSAHRGRVYTEVTISIPRCDHAQCFKPRDKKNRHGVDNQNYESTWSPIRVWWCHRDSRVPPIKTWLRSSIQICSRDHAKYCSKHCVLQSIACVYTLVGRNIVALINLADLTQRNYVKGSLDWWIIINWLNGNLILISSQMITFSIGFERKFFFFWSTQRVFLFQYDDILFIIFELNFFEKRISLWKNFA